MSEAASHKKTIKEVSHLICVLSLVLVIMSTFYTSSTEVRTYVRMCGTVRKQVLYS